MSEEPRPTLVEARELVLDHGATSAFELRVPELAVPRGSQVVITGPSGCGKSTLLDTLAGLHVPRSGHVRIGDTTLYGEGDAPGAPPLSDAARRRFRIQHVGFVFQTFELLEPLSVLENMLLPFTIHPTLRLTKAVRARARSLAERLGIAAHLNRKPRTLSHGERQRAAIGRALITEPMLLLADEPTGNLDPETTETILALLLEEAARIDATLLMVTHDHGVLDRFEAHLALGAAHPEGVA